MPRRYGRRRRGRYDDYDDDYSYGRRRRQGGCLAPIRRFFRNLGIIILIALGSVLAFVLLLLIAFHFALFIEILVYLFWIALVLAAIWVIYLVVRMITAISTRLSNASERKARAKIAHRRADLEHERVNRAQLDLEAQEAKMSRDAYLFYQKQERGDSYYQSPRRTRNFREEEGYEEERPRRRTRIFQEEEPVRLAAEAIEPQKPPTIPSITQLIGRAIVASQKDMLYGFEMENDNLLEIRGDWPGTAIIAGKSGSGKTRRVIGMVFQAILTRKKITICDPHAYKPDGLIKILAPFARWLIFARTNEEIIAAAKEHIAELESRLSPTGSLNGEGLTPRLIIFDEFPALMKNESIGKEDKRAITKCVRESATQYRGVFGAAWIIGQEFTEDALGDTAIRKDAHAILCHQLSDEYVRFLFPRDLKTQRLIQQIARRECVFKDSDNNIKRIATPTVLDEEIPNMVAYLERVIPPHSQAPSQSARSTATLHSRQTEANPPRVYGAPARQQQIVLLGDQGVSPSAPSSQSSQPRVAPRIPRRPTTEPVVPQSPPVVPSRPRQQRQTSMRSTPLATWGEEPPPLPPRISSRRLVAPLTAEDLERLSQPSPGPTTTTDALDEFDALAALRDQRQQQQQQNKKRQP